MSSSSSSSSSYTLWDTIVPTSKQYLHALRNLVLKADEHCKATGTSFSKVIAPARLAPDMYGFSWQVHTATDLCERLAARINNTPYTDVFHNEEELSTAESMLARIDKAQAALDGTQSAKLFERLDDTVGLQVGPNLKETKVGNSILGHSMPNIAFHTTTAYAILRSHGVQVGKRDFLRPFFDGFVPEIKI